MPERRRRPRQDYADTVGDGWSGSIAYPADGDGVTFVSGQWTVPGVVVPAGSQGLSACATWIGIDGSPNAGKSGDIVQAGTTRKSSPTSSASGLRPSHGLSGSPRIRAPSPTCPSPGDVMYCVICLYTSKGAAVS